MYEYKCKRHAKGAKMKTLIIILTLIQVLSTKSRACDYNNDEIKETVKLADKVSDLLGDDSKYAILDQHYEPSIQKKKAYYAMKPINPAELEKQIEYNTVGNVTISGSNGSRPGSGTGVKIGKSCILTSAHNLYHSADVSVDNEEFNRFNGKIQFSRGGNSNLGTVNAKVFFKMTEENKDFEIGTDEKGNLIRIFKGHNDLVILQLEKADHNYKKVAVRTPESFSALNPEMGEKITCQGLPIHAVEKTYGNCSGNQFLWEQKNARIFTNHMKKGLSTNLASTKGMSGGSCSLNVKPDEVFAIVSNGFSVDAFGNYVMPNLKFSKGNIENGAASYLSLLHILDQRMKKELGYGLDKIVEKCN